MKFCYGSIMYGMGRSYTIKKRKTVKIDADGDEAFRAQRKEERKKERKEKEI